MQKSSAEDVFPYREGMMRLIKDTHDPLKLPPGYRLDFSDPDVLVLRRLDGEAVGRFIARSFALEAVELAAAEDYWEV